MSMYSPLNRLKLNKSKAVSLSIGQRKKNGRNNIFEDNRLEANKQNLLKEVISRGSHDEVLVQRFLDDKELEEWADRPEDELSWMDEDERRQLAIYKQKLAANEVDKAAFNSIKQNGNYKTWKYNGENYHMNLKYDTPHITWESSSREHYFFQGSAEEIKDKQPTKKERGQHAHVFSELPINLQNFIKKNYLDLI